jgi:chemotaxis protein MotB
MRWLGLPQVPRPSGGGDERWLITYADMITLLLVLFIILYATANTDLQKFAALAEAIAKGFGATEDDKTARQGEGGASIVFDTSGGGTKPLELFPEGQIPISIFDFAQMLGNGGGQESGGGAQGAASAASAAGAAGAAGAGAQGSLGQQLGQLAAQAIAEAQAGGELPEGLAPGGITPEMGIQIGNVGMGARAPGQGETQGQQGAGQQAPGQGANAGQTGAGPTSPGQGASQGQTGAGEQAPGQGANAGQTGAGPTTPGQGAAPGDQGAGELTPGAGQAPGDQGAGELSPGQGAAPGEQGLGKLEPGQGRQPGDTGAGEMENVGRGKDIQDLGAGIEISYNERGIVISIFPDQILFDSGSAHLKPAFMKILEALVGPLSQLPNQIEVDGHTDSVPIHTLTYPSNWELSAGRAGSVGRYLITHGLPRERLRVAGYADTRPVDINQTVKGRARNRRVEIVVLRLGDEPMPQVPSAGQPPAATPGAG